MYKLITVCTNCGTKFEDDLELNENEVKIFFDADCNDETPIFGPHECADGSIGMQVFKCFKKV